MSHGRVAEADRGQPPQRAEEHRARTPEGKARSSANAVRHGLCAQVLVVEREQGPYEQFVAGLRRELAPASALQEFLFQRLAGLAWRLGRAGRLEGWWMQREEEQILERRRPQPQPVRRGRKPQKQPPEPTDPTPVEPEQAMSWMVSDKPKRLQLLWRYEGQLERSFQKTLKQFMELKESEGAVEEQGEGQGEEPVETAEEQEVPATGNGEADAVGPADALTRAGPQGPACALPEGEGVRNEPISGSAEAGASEVAASDPSSPEAIEAVLRNEPTSDGPMKTVPDVLGTAGSPACGG